MNYSRRRGGVMPLWAGEGDLATRPFIAEAATRALAAGETFYTWQRGIPELREGLARYHSRLYGREFSSVALPGPIRARGRWGRVGRFDGRRALASARFHALCVVDRFGRRAGEEINQHLCLGRVSAGRRDRSEEDQVGALQFGRQ
jgi:hypothetical protein